MKINKFDKSNLEVIRREVEDALNTIKEKYGLTDSSLGTITYMRDGSSLSAKLELRSGGAKTKDDEKIEISKRIASRYGLNPEDIGKSFSYRGEMYKILHIDSRKRKYPIICKDRKGGEYKFPVEIVKNSLT